jgi:2C-methyl-D-erythritol 2,4-cyclodiphosphate synthase
MKDEQLESLLVYSFRYALGRMTYAVSDVAMAIILNKHVLHPYTKELIRKEIAEAISMDRAGMEMDVEEWSNVYAELGDE